MLGDVKLKTIRLLDETMKSSGSKEYLEKMSSFIDMAQKQLALALPIKKTVKMTSSNQILAKAPDMRQISQIRSVDLKKVYPVIELGDGYLVQQDGEYLVEYFAYPQTITDDTPDDYQFPIAPEAEDAIPFLAAALCVPYDEPQIYAMYLSLYNERIANLMGKEQSTIRIRQSDNGGDF